MTLHWWMHWFWVTLKFTVIFGIPVSLVKEDPTIKYDSSTVWQSVTEKMTTNSDEILSEVEPTVANMRIAKAINFYQPSMKGNVAVDPSESRPSTNASITIKNTQDNSEYHNNDSIDPYTFIPDERTTNFWSGQTEIQKEELIDDFRIKNDKIYQKRKDTRITWILTTSRPLIRQNHEEKSGDLFSNLSTTEKKDLTVLPLKLEERRIKFIVNRTQITTGDNNETLFSTRISNSSEDIEIDQELAEPRVSSVTKVPLFADSNRISRARNAFVSDFRIDRAQDRSSQDNIEEIESEKNIDSISVQSSTFDIAVITGSCLAMVVFLSAMVSFGFIMYRRKYLNPPQTLNSDKCSNPDTSGYIDDSTIQDNSEEMYSLDNDSFLNSLEAMTIQNYWTDSVKHTKL
ncbi:uncharacterized protein LOC123263390 [Cotesia glomerata]|uniref:Uncharacterized protein n=1 Tax=Cotesia glomerata TaxID=32391 RepID=A0AAV7IJW1_COTGL|nr:uncharacterized protein LOC123263390 [Cotesia glomerata]XP_044582059.1 uncharacterized protein LOC123263390 [Cotesia glomerata]XP_044582060.1 uncharacterized protein LOC123263390 [Cotesia glomerata]XP_044582061.1 uncharacterized protein LOC123263390 [Cotesia glomerata]XP_044582062.1 uncharacterized protein LOC123263390 [Cotesia glomerata]KAH0554388.1 hypothetical protein KQX54_010248 [Cotesia glomerata]